MEIRNVPSLSFFAFYFYFIFLFLTSFFFSTTLIRWLFIIHASIMPLRFQHRFQRTLLNFTNNKRNRALGISSNTILKRSRPHCRKM